MINAFITNYPKYCLFCNKPKTDTHHLVYGGANRKLADEDNLVIPVCRDCHDFIHKNGMGGKLSKMLGQALFELNYLADKEQIIEARREYCARYGKSYF